MPDIRLRRLESLLREEISAMIARGQIKDPRVEPLTTVTEVNLSRDMGHAKVWVSRFGDREALNACVEALNHAAGFIQGILARRISLRIFPRLQFFRDDAMENGFRVAQKLKELQDTTPPADPGTDDETAAPGGTSER